MGGRRKAGFALVAALISSAAAAPAALGATTHAEYVAEVTPICEDAARDAKRIPRRIKKTGIPFIDSLQKSALYAKLLKKTIRRIGSVDPAPGYEAAVESWLDKGRRMVRQIRKLLRAVRHGKPKRAKVVIKRAVRTQREGREEAAALGLGGCGRGAPQVG